MCVSSDFEWDKFSAVRIKRTTLINFFQVVSTPFCEQGKPEKIHFFQSMCGMPFADVGSVDDSQKYIFKFV